MSHRMHIHIHMCWHLLNDWRPKAGHSALAYEERPVLTYAYMRLLKVHVCVLCVVNAWYSAVANDLSSHILCWFCICAPLAINELFALCGVALFRYYCLSGWVNKWKVRRLLGRRHVGVQMPTCFCCVVGYCFS